MVNGDGDYKWVGDEAGEGIVMAVKHDDDDFDIASRKWESRRA